MIRALLSCALIAATTFSAAAAATLACPPAMPESGTSFEQIGAAPAKPAKLESLHLYDGKPGEESRPAPAELAPDSTQQQAGSLLTKWIFAGNESLLLVCRYHGTSTYYRAALQQLPHGCTMRSSPRATVAICE
jgi:hypothetical protein